MSTPLSVVIITKNLEWNVTRILDSIYREIPDIDEIILVDSASSDTTVDLACNYPKPVRVISLDANQRLTAAAGRYVGHQNTNNDYILFMDGDTELLPGYYEKASKILNENPEIGVVGGKYINVPLDSDGKVTLDRKENPGFKDVFHSGGAVATYRRAALEAAGSFIPYIYSDEEPMLAVRIRHQGYRVVQLDYPSALHYTNPPDKVSTIIARRNRNLWIGHGQNLRYFIGTDMFFEYLKERGHGIPPALYLLYLAFTVVMTIITLNLLWIGSALALIVAVFLLLVIRKRSLEAALHTLVKRFIIFEGTVRGLMDTPLKPEDYHLDYKIVRP